MKKSELKQLIREEISKAIYEGGPFDALGSAYGAFQTKQNKPSTVLKVHNDEIPKIKSSDMLESTGILRKIGYKDDVAYYIEFKHMNVPLHLKLIDKLGDDKLDKMVDKEYKTKIEVWDQFANRPDEKFRVTDIK